MHRFHPHRKVASQLQRRYSSYPVIRLLVLVLHIAILKDCCFAFSAHMGRYSGRLVQSIGETHNHDSLAGSGSDLNFAFKMGDPASFFLPGSLSGKFPERSLTQDEACLKPTKELLFVLAPRTDVIAEAPKSAVDELRVMESSLGNAVLRLIVTARNVSVAEEFQVILEVDAPAGSQVEWMDVSWSELGFFMVEDRMVDSVPIINGAGDRRWRRTYRLEQFKSGEWSLPGFQANVKLSSKSEAVKLKSESVAIVVEGLLEKDSGFETFRDLKDLPDHDVKPSSYPAVWIVLAVSAVVGGIIYAILRRRRRISPEGRATTRIELLQSSVTDHQSLLQTQAQLAVILKDYLGEVFQINIATQTTLEVVMLLEQRGVDVATSVEVKRFLQLDDEIRYSGSLLGERPAEGEGAQSLEEMSGRVNRLVQQLSQWRLAATQGKDD